MRTARAKRTAHTRVSLNGESRLMVPLDLAQGNPIVPWHVFDLRIGTAVKHPNVESRVRRARSFNLNDMVVHTFDPVHGNRADGARLAQCEVHVCLSCPRPLFVVVAVDSDEGIPARDDRGKNMAQHYGEGENQSRK